MSRSIRARGSSRFHNVAEARELARRRLPRVAFDYVDGGAEDEISLARNRRAFADIELVPRFLAPGTQPAPPSGTAPQLAVEVAGTRMAFPVGITPTGLAGIVQRDADVSGARAAGAEGTLFVLATLANSSIEQVAAAATGPLWFQLYSWSDRGAVERLIGRAAAAGFAALVVTIDCPDIGNRERDRRNGFALPPRPTARNAWDVVRHAGWTRSMLAGFDFPNVRSADEPPPRGLLPSMWAAQAANESLYDCTVSTADLQWIRERWSGPLVVKGVLSAEDARIAADCGADAVVVSNHGGRQLDGASASLTALPTVVAEVGERVDVLLDSGVRRGSDVVKALALGAKACFIGRPWLFGLGAGGEPGVRHVLAILREEMQRTMGLLGAHSVDELDAFVRRD